MTRGNQGVHFVFQKSKRKLQLWILHVKSVAWSLGANSLHDTVNVTQRYEQGIALLIKMVDMQHDTILEEYVKLHFMEKLKNELQINYCNILNWVYSDI